MFKIFRITSNVAQIIGKIGNSFEEKFNLKQPQFSFIIILLLLLKP